MARGIKPIKDRSIVRSKSIKIRFSPKEVDRISKVLKEQKGDVTMSSYLREIILKELDKLDS